MSTNERKILAKFTIDEIEKTTEKEAKAYAFVTGENFKDGFNYYIVDFGGYFGVSILVFKNNRIIKYAGDYELHHKEKTLDELIKYYQDNITKKIFSFDDLKIITDYDDYYNKSYFLRNYLPYAFNQASVYDKDIDKNVYKYRSLASFSSRFKYAEDAEYITKLFVALETLYNERMKYNDFFYNALVNEMFNHESAISWDGYTPALEALGVRYERETDERKQIINKAYKYVCKHTRC